MDPKRRDVSARREELRAKRQELHGRRRELHDRLAEVCEEFALGDLTLSHRKQALVAELQYLHDYYFDERNWEGID
jgi:hypothetical protein